MALTHLVDTSVLARLARPQVRSLVEPAAAKGRLGRARISDLEVGFSARNVGEWESLMSALEILTAVETTAAHVRRALQVQRALAGRSQKGRKLPDLLIAAAAEELNLGLLHYDADFDLIAAITGQSCEWVVPAGTVD